MKGCSLPNCGQRHVARGLCAKHYQRGVKSGELTTAGKGWKRGRIQHQDGSACTEDRCSTCVARFMAKVSKTDECWEWLGSTRRGYGRFRYQGRTHGTHRLAYRWFVGPLSDVETVDHLCFNTRCVRPEHLKIATHLWNAKRQRSWLSGACKSGHLRTPENVYVERSTGKRKCRPCAAERQRRYRERRAQPRDLIAAVAEALS